MSEHQPDSPDTGLICLLMLARFHNVAASGEQLAHEFTDGQQAFATPQLLLASRKLGLKAKRVASRP